MVKISPVVDALPPSGIRAFFDLVLTMEDVVSLGVGEPDFTTPWHISDYAIQKIESGFTTYTSNSGLLELRRELALYTEKLYGASYDPEKEILLTVGVSEAVDLALRAMIMPGDEVLVVEPSYVAYRPLITLAGGIPKSVFTSKENGFKLTPDLIRTEATSRTRAIIFNYPCNPTGTTYNREELKALADVFEQLNIFVFSDEIYHHLSFDHGHVSLSGFEGFKDRVLHLNGFSKGFAMTGWRVGYACGPSNLISAMTKIHQYTIMCVPIMGQFAAIEALRHGEESVQEMKIEYQRRRNFVVKRLNEIGLKCHKPGGAFYAFPEIPSAFKSGTEFANGLLKKKRVAVVPGAAFGLDRHIRISYASSIQKLELALNRMAEFIAEENQSA